ncbi:MAG: hypothetical protein WB609_07835 [Candidatus Cybelea sp.]
MPNSHRPWITISVLIAVSLSLAACNSGSSLSSAVPQIPQQKRATAKRSASSCPCLYVPSEGAVRVYPANASGNVKPIRTIHGSNTGLHRAWDVALDADGNIYVANYGTHRLPGDVTVYGAGARGNVSPIRTIGGSYTNMSKPAGVALDSAGKLYVSNWGSNTVTIYAPGANGNVAPINTIGGPNMELARFRGELLIGHHAA